MSKFCPKCEKQLEDVSSVCPACGTSVEQVAVEQPTMSQTQYQSVGYGSAPQEVPPAPQKNKKTKAILISVIAAVALIGVVIGILFATGAIGKKEAEAEEVISTPESVSKAFVAEICEGDAEGAYSYFASFMGETWFEVFCEKYLDLFEGYKPSIKVVSVEEWEQSECEDMKYLYQYVYGFESDTLQIASAEVEVTFKGEGAPRKYVFDITLAKYDEDWVVTSFGEKN